MICQNQVRLDSFGAGLPEFRPEPIARAFVVASGSSVGGMDLSRLPTAETIAVNRSFTAVRAGSTFIMDDRLIEWLLDDKWGCRSKFLQQRVVMPSPLGFRTPIQRKWPVSYVRRNLEDVPAHAGKRVFFGSNSGFGAVQLSLWMGARQVYLIGFDMHADNGTHFHSGYGEASPESQREKYASFRLEMERFAPRWAAAGVGVVNLTPGSALKCFPFKKLDDVL